MQATKRGRQLAFYTIPEYEEWREGENGAAGWEIKYYKGLGTSTKEEAIEYFGDIDRHRKEFVWEGERAAHTCASCCLPHQHRRLIYVLHEQRPESMQLYRRVLDLHLRLS